MLANPGWDALDDTTQKMLYERAIHYGRELATAKALPPEARIAEAQRLANEIMKLRAPKAPANQGLQPNQ
jgi:hypothetical protein